MTIQTYVVILVLRKVYVLKISGKIPLCPDLAHFRFEFGRYQGCILEVGCCPANLGPFGLTQPCPEGHKGQNCTARFFKKVQNLKILTNKVIFLHLYDLFLMAFRVSMPCSNCTAFWNLVKKPTVSDALQVSRMRYSFVYHDRIFSTKRKKDRISQIYPA